MTAALPQMTEAQFRRLILDTAKVFGWRRAGFRPAQNRRGMWSTAMDGDVGWLDVFLAKEFGDEVRGLALELKVGTRKLTREQEIWLRLMARIPGVTARCVYPADWPWIESKLRGEI